MPYSSSLLHRSSEAAGQPQHPNPPPGVRTARPDHLLHHPHQPTDLSVRPQQQQPRYPASQPAGYTANHYSPYPHTVPSHHFSRASPTATVSSPSPLGSLRSSPYDSPSSSLHAVDGGGHNRYRNPVVNSFSIQPPHVAAGILSSGSQPSPTASNRVGLSTASRHPTAAGSSHQLSVAPPIPRPGLAHQTGDYGSLIRPSASNNSQAPSAAGGHHVMSLGPSGRPSPLSAAALGTSSGSALSSSHSVGRYDTLAPVSQQHMAGQSKAAHPAATTTTPSGRVNSVSAQLIQSSQSAAAVVSSSQQQAAKPGVGAAVMLGAGGINPISLEQRINKVISQNQAIVETLGETIRCPNHVSFF